MKTSRPLLNIIYPSIERDKRYYWHPVIEIRQRGVIVFAAALVVGHMRPEMAHWQAEQEAERLSKKNG